MKDRNHVFDNTILRAYDIRGIVGESLHNIDAEIIGRVFASLVCYENKNNIVVCMDGRLSSPKLSDSLVKGLKYSGANIIDIGIGPTPMLYFSSHHFNAAGAIMITGSHNPPEYNGFKFMRGKDSFFGQDIINLGKSAAKGKWNASSGKFIIRAVMSDYINALLNSTMIEDIDSNLKVVWDAGNGATGKVLEKLIKKLPNCNILLNSEIDGNFPSHHPDPSEPKNLEQLINCVKKNNFDAGIAFDGDGDRVGLVTGKGRIIWGDQILALLSKKVLKNCPGAKIIADVKASGILTKEIEKQGGELFTWKTGHSLIKTKMKEINSPLAGEMSGHIFFSDRYYGYDDGIYAALRIIENVENNSYLDDFLDSLPKVFNTPEIRIECSEEDKFEIVNKLISILESNNIKVSKIDGLRVKYDNGWWLLRASNTQNALVLRLEAETLEYLEFVKSEVRKYILPFGLSVNL